MNHESKNPTFRPILHETGAYFVRLSRRVNLFDEVEQLGITKVMRTRDDVKLSECSFLLFETEKVNK